MLKMTRVGLAALGGWIAASLAGAAWPQEPAPQPEKPAEQVYKNIQVFKGLPNSRLLSAMFFMEGSLQVSCGHCHDWNDFSKDDKQSKRTARKMILMVEELNKTQFEGKQLVSCTTCHRGQTPPAASLPFAKVEEAAPGRPGSKDASTALPSAQELFAREVQAAGGEHAMDNIHSRVMHGTRYSSEGWSSPVEIYEQGPDKWRDSFKLKAEFVGVFDGSHGWGQDDEGVHNSDPPELERLKLDADFYRNGKLGERFLNARATGKEKVNGQDAYVVEAQTPEGDRRQLYFDVVTGLLLRIVRFDSSPFGPIPNAVDYADYRELDGVQVPFTISHLRPDYSLLDRLTKIEQNVAIDPKTFNKPIMPAKP
ncbi:MAG TPA: photosynthetic reaction center cytochrome c subunit family protein [Candidatus Acidoferrales bacterium]|nr:photosynthetic reaction center cytochrome c subunit family protein [Candidatus Acidoferrales bacterium]